MENIETRFQKNLHALRKDRLRLTQTEAAERIGISLRYYQQLEKGESWPSAETLNSIEAAFKCSASDLFKSDEVELTAAEALKSFKTLFEKISANPLFSLLEIEEPSHQDTLLAAAEALKSEPPIGSLSRVAAPKKKYQK